MSEAERHIAAFDRAMAGHLWSAAMRLQREVLELREENAKLLALVGLIPCYHYCLPKVIVEHARKLIARAEKLK